MKPSLPAATRLRLRENQLFLALSIIVGVLAGLSAVLFALCIDHVGRTLFGLEPSSFRLFAIPATVSLITGVLLARWFPHVRLSHPARREGRGRRGARRVQPCAAHHSSGQNPRPFTGEGHKPLGRAARARDPECRERATVFSGQNARLRADRPQPCADAA